MNEDKHFGDSSLYKLINLNFESLIKIIHVQKNHIRCVALPFESMQN